MHPGDATLPANFLFSTPRGRGKIAFLPEAVCARSLLRPNGARRGGCVPLESIQTWRILSRRYLRLTNSLYLMRGCSQTLLIISRLLRDRGDLINFPEGKPQTPKWIADIKGTHSRVARKARVTKIAITAIPELAKEETRQPGMKRSMKSVERGEQGSRRRSPALLTSPRSVSPSYPIE